MSDRSLRFLSVLGFAGTVAAVAGLLAVRGLFSPSPAAIAVQALALVLMVWARRTFGARSFHAAADPTAGGLVTDGPYRFVRHPIYAAILYFVWAGVLGQWHALGGPLPRPRLVQLALALGATAGTVLRIACEERLLRARYPEYAAYAARVRRVVPGLL